MSRISSLILLIVPLKALIITDLNLKERIFFLLGFLAYFIALLLFELMALQDQPISVYTEEDKSPLVSLELKVLSQCPSLIIVCSLVVIWVDCFTGPVHKCFYGGGQKPSCLMRFYHVQKLQFLVTVVVVVVVVCQKNTCLISSGLSHTVAVQEHSTLMLV